MDGVGILQLGEGRGHVKRSTCEGEGLELRKQHPETLKAGGETGSRVERRGPGPEKLRKLCSVALREGE